MIDKTNAIEGEFHGFPPDIYDVKYELSTVLKRGNIDPDDNFEKDFLEYGYIQEFYTPELYCALHYGYFLRNDYERNCYVTDRIEFFHCYIDAFNAEKQDFDNKNVNRQYPKNSEEYDLYVTYLKGKLDDCKIIFQKPDFISYHLCETYGRYAGLFSRIIEIIDDDLNLQQRIKDLTGDDFVLQQRIIKLMPNNSLQQIPEPLEKINLKDEQRTLLFDLLVNGGFINNENKDSFLYAFGGEKPNKYIPIHWNYGANALFELLKILTGTVSNENMKRRTNGLFENINKLNRPKEGEYSAYIGKIEDIKNKIFPTT